MDSPLTNRQGPEYVDELDARGRQVRVRTKDGGQSLVVELDQRDWRGVRHRVQLVLDEEVATRLAGLLSLETAEMRRERRSRKTRFR